MDAFQFVNHIVRSTMFASVALLAFVYSLPILGIRRFQHRNNIFTLNVCFAIGLNCLSRLVTTMSPMFGYSSDNVRKKWPWLYVLQILSDTAIPLSLVLMSFHQCFAIVYPHERVFRTQTWINGCFTGQWTLVGLLSIPDFVHPRAVRLFLQSSPRSHCMHTRLDIACTVATSVQISDYANHSSNYLYHHQHIDLRPCSFFVEPCSNSRCTEREPSKACQTP